MKKHKIEILLTVSVVLSLVGLRTGWIKLQEDQEFITYIYATHNSYVFLATLTGAFFSLVAMKLRNRTVNLILILLGTIATLSALYSITSWVPDSTERQILNINLDTGYWFTVLSIYLLLFTQIYTIGLTFFKKTKTK